MKSLYVKIVGLVCLVLLVSALIALLISNVLYYTVWQASYSQKVEEAVETSFAYYERHGDRRVDSFYEMLSATGFQLYVVSESGQVKRYGNPFRNETIAPAVIQSVQEGQVYQGMRDYPFHLFLLGLFDNEVINTYGTSLETDTGTDAVFIRPDLSRQIRELHLFVGAFLALLILLSFLLLVFSIRYLVRPIKRLTTATERMTTGDYSISVATTGQDEIGELSRRFDEMAQAVAKSDAERKAFIANVSHEFQSPLTTIRGYAGQLDRSARPEDRSKLRTIGQEATRMAELTRQLLTLARLDEGRPLRRQPIQLIQSIQATLETLRYQLDERGVAVALDASDDPVIRADELALEQIFQNLIRNALHVSAEGDLITIQVDTQADSVIVQIKDQGPGMTEQVIAHAFERFYQGDASRGTSGTGLGLAIVKETMDQLDGQIRIESIPDAGTTIVLTFVSQD